MAWAPEAMPACRAIQPTWRPMTSAIMQRWWDSPVVRSRSIASVAISHGGVEAEGVVRGVEVVVDRLGDAHDLQAGVGEPLGGGQGALAADGDDGVDAEPVHVGLDDLGPAAVLERVGAGRAEDGAALLGDAADHGAGDLDDVALDDAAPAVQESHELAGRGRRCP